jgi:hypothetical protein
MAEAKTQEPSIEEILSSIRQIISEDQKDDSVPPSDFVLKGEIEAPLQSDLVLKGEVEAQDKSDFVLKGEAEEKYQSDLTLKGDDTDAPDQAGPLELTEEVLEDISHEGESMKNDDIDAILNAPSVAMDAPKIDMQDSIISEQAAHETENAMAKLAQNVAIFSHEPDRIAPPQGPTLEEITRSLLKPMLKQWLDTNLPPLVERLVQKEIEKITQKLK